MGELDGKATLLRRHGDSRRLATLLATAVYLTTRAVDDALDLLEVLIATKLLAKAERETVKEKIKTLPRVERASAKLATAFQVVFDTTSEQVDTDTGEVSGPKVESFEAMWEQIEAVVPRQELAAAMAALFELTPPLDSDADEAWRASRRSCGTTSTCWAGTPSSSPTCPVACVRYATGKPPRRSDRSGLLSSRRRP
ncbi:hypothetical protein OG395_49620 [Streptomyces sp. NBC_01320]|nr:hypothetical protein OG395_49620 [Streptomyces sp. NBC_01320]